MKTETAKFNMEVSEMIYRLESLYERVDQMSDEEILDEYSKIYLDHPPIQKWDL